MTTKKDIASTSDYQGLIQKIHSLPPDRIADVQDFVDFLSQRHSDRLLTQAAAKLFENVFQKVWDNPDDADYYHL